MSVECYYMISLAYDVHKNQSRLSKILYNLYRQENYIYF